MTALHLVGRRTGERCCKTRMRRFPHSLVKKMAIPFSLSHPENCRLLVWFLEFPRRGNIFSGRNPCDFWVYYHTICACCLGVFFFVLFFVNKNTFGIYLKISYKPGTRQHLTYVTPLLTVCTVKAHWLQTKMNLRRSHGHGLQFELIHRSKYYLVFSETALYFHFLLSNKPLCCFILFSFDNPPTTTTIFRLRRRLELWPAPVLPSLSTQWELGWCQSHSLSAPLNQPLSAEPAAPPHPPPPFY